MRSDEPGVLDRKDDASDLPDNYAFFWLKKTPYRLFTFVELLKLT